MGKVSKDRLVHGVGINDVGRDVHKFDYSSGKTVRIWTCPYYQKWRGMLERCHSKKLHNKKPTYIGCSVDPDWLYLSNFIKWVDSQPNRDWQNCHLDKDLLVIGNKHYSPSTCCFISSELNVFLTTSKAARGNYPLGVCIREDRITFRARCYDPLKQLMHT